MKTIGIRELRANLTDHVRAAGRGEEVQIACHGRAIAKLVPCEFAPEALCESTDAGPIDPPAEKADEPSGETVPITIKAYTLTPQPSGCGGLPDLSLIVVDDLGHQFAFPLRNLWFSDEGTFQPQAEHRLIPPLPGLDVARVAQLGARVLMGHTFKVDQSFRTNSWGVFGRLNHVD